MTTRTKRDTFEEMARQAAKAHRWAGEDTIEFAVRLLRRQHNAVVRAVKKHEECVPHDIPRDEMEDASNKQHLATCRAILATLARMKGGR